MKEKFKDMEFLKLGKYISDRLIEKGYDVLTDFNGGTRPEKYKGVIPDLAARKNDGTIYIEVVTKEFLDNRENLKRVVEFSRAVASEPQPNIRFALMINKDELVQIKKIIREKSIYVNTIYYSEF